MGTDAAAAPGDSGCETCTLCCRVPAIQALDKPGDTWCAHCEPARGCGIYEGRPQGCRDFRCMWLGTRTGHDPGPPLPAALRPDRCGVIFTPGMVTLPDGRREGAMVLVADARRPGAWTAPAVQAEIARMRRAWPRLGFHLSVGDRMRRLPESQ